MKGSMPDWRTGKSATEKHAALLYNDCRLVNKIPHDICLRCVCDS